MKSISFILIGASLIVGRASSRTTPAPAAPIVWEVSEAGLRTGPRGPSAWHRLLLYTNGRFTLNHCEVMQVWTVLPDSQPRVRLT